MILYKDDDTKIKFQAISPPKKRVAPLLSSYLDCVAFRQSCFHIRWIRL